jgi:predicted metal-dependent peptidase
MFEPFAKMSPSDKMLKAKTQLVKKHPFYASLMYNMKFIASENDIEMPTMGVNEYGWLYWGVDFVKQIGDVEGLMAVIVHEILHVAMLTFQREGNRHHKLWNVSTDIANNYILAKSRLRLPDDVISKVTGKPMKFYEPSVNGQFDCTINDIKISMNVDNMTAEDIYEHILDKIKDTDAWKNGGGEGGGGEGGGDGSGQVESDKEDLDKHMESGVGPDGKPDNSTQNSNGQAISKEFNEKKWKTALSKAAQAAKAAGNNGHAFLDRFIDELLNPKLNWKAILYNYIVPQIPFDYTMNRPSRRSYTTGIYLPSTLRENLELTICVDVSGSISEDEYREFIGEVIGICNVSDNIQARLLFWDTEVDETSIHMITRHNRDMIKKIFPKGGGGTDISAIRRYVEKVGVKSQLFVYLTDGCVWNVNTDTLPEGKNLCIITSTGSEQPLSDYAMTVKLRD